MKRVKSTRLSNKCYFVIFYCSSDLYLGIIRYVIKNLTYFCESKVPSSQSNVLLSTEVWGGEDAIVVLWEDSYEKHLQ